MSLPKLHNSSGRRHPSSGRTADEAPKACKHRCDSAARATPQAETPEARRLKKRRAPAEPPAGWSSVFSVYAGAPGSDNPALLGAYRVDAGSLVFRPRFPLAPGMHVRAVFQPPEGEPVEAAFDVPAAAPATPSTRVAHVYPSSATLPANALKLYIYFDAPMTRGGSWQHIHLLRDGQPVAYPFLELDQELWDREQRRFTVLFDPGRIKRGLASLAEGDPHRPGGHGRQPQQPPLRCRHLRPDHAQGHCGDRDPAPADSKVTSASIGGR